MTGGDVAVVGSYDYRLVALSVLIAVLASYAALDLAARVTAARGGVRFAWLFGGATAMGTGIWSMHYIGMLAFNLPFPVLYNWPTVLLSFLAAICASGFALFVVSRQKMRLRQALVGSVIMGAGIATMHYTGMEAMRLPAMCHYSSALVALSVVLAIMISLVALWLTFYFRNDAKEKWVKKIASAVLMGAAIPVMHYTGMAAASFTFTGVQPDLSHAVNVSSLGLAGISIVTIMVLGLAVLTSLVDKRFSALETSQERLRLIINTALDAVITTDSEGRITNWNTEAEKIFGWPSQEVLGQHLSGLILPPLHRDSHEARIQLFQGAGEGAAIRQRIEITGMHRNGSAFPIELAISPVNFGGEWIFSTFIRDITEDKRAQEELLAAKNAAEEANRAKSIFLAKMSHELRTPLNAIIGYSEMLEEETQESGQVGMVRDLQKIQSAGKHLLSLINDILDLSKIEAGKMELHPETFSVATVIEEIASTVQPAVDTNGNIFQVNVATNAGEMRTDITKLRQILLNLLSNACKFTNHGSITLSVDRAARDGRDWLRFRIEDSGIGITEEQKKCLFKEFSQADVSISSRYGGTGLGLAITARFVQMMRGNVSVESVPGLGSTFTVWLPAEIAGDTVETQLPDTLVDPSSWSREDTCHRDTVLVIDDDSAVRDLMHRFLTKLGFDVVAGESGEEGLRLARQVHPLVITLDVMMPGIDGWLVLKKMKADPELAHIPIIMLSVVDNERRALALGASSYLMKPVDRDRLAMLLQHYRFARSSADGPHPSPEPMAIFD